MGAASFKSLYPKRPWADATARGYLAGAPDTALRLLFIYPAAQKADYDQVVPTIEKSFIPGDLEHAQ